MTGLVWTVGCSKAARSTLLHRTYWNKSIGRCSVADDLLPLFTVTQCDEQTADIVLATVPSETVVVSHRR